MKGIDPMDSVLSAIAFGFLLGSHLAAIIAPQRGTWWDELGLTPPDQLRTSSFSSDAIAAGLTGFAR
jgi:hypothetical protein